MQLYIRNTNLCVMMIKSNKLLTKPIQYTKKYKSNTTVLNRSLLNSTNNIFSV